MSLQDKFLAIRKRLRKVLPDWINFQNLIFITVILAFMVIVFWSESMSKHFAAARLAKVGATITPSVLPGTPTPLPAELISSAEQTNGILVGAIIILLAILVGTLAMVLREISK
jgi:hypothetical protein